MSKFSKSNKKGKEKVDGDKENGQPGIADEKENISLPVDGDKEKEWVLTFFQCWRLFIVFIEKFFYLNSLLSKFSKSIKKGNKKVAGDEKTR